MKIDSDVHTLLIEYQVTSSMLNHVLRELSVEFLLNAYDSPASNFKFLTSFSGSDFAEFINQGQNVKINIETSAEKLTEQLLRDLLLKTKETITRAFEHKKKNQTAAKTVLIKTAEAQINFTKVREECLKQFMKELHKVRVIDSFLLERNLIYFFKPILEIVQWQIVKFVKKLM